MSVEIITENPDGSISVIGQGLWLMGDFSSYDEYLSLANRDNRSLPSDVKNELEATIATPEPHVRMNLVQRALGVVGLELIRKGR